MKYSPELVLLLLAIAAAAVTAQNSPEDFVEAHNAARADVGVEPVTWNETVAAYAEAYAELRRRDCLLKTSPAGGPYGENLFRGAGADKTGVDAVARWVSNKQYYDHATDTCSAPATRTCLTYTQVVWRASTAIGCARVVCRSGDRVFVICNYSPPGNLVGESPY